MSIKNKSTEAPRTWMPYEEYLAYLAKQKADKKARMEKTRRMRAKRRSKEQTTSTA